MRGNKSCHFPGQLLFLGFVLIFGLVGCASPDNFSGIIQTATLPDAEPANTLRSVQGGEVLKTPINVMPLEFTQTSEPIQIIATPAKNYDYSILTLAQRERLYRTSLTFLADTEEKAIQVARDLRYVEKWGHPATLCGPLSMGILQRAGLVDRTVDLHDFWLLNPRDEYTVATILEDAFPPDEYLWYRTKTPLNQFDFSEFPLYSGDFVYLYAGPRGTFEHMLTVSRVDETGRAYAVTNELYSGMYSISEVILYDPHNPGVGFFYDLTNIDNMYSLGVTGFGGFQLWRPVKPIIDLTPEEKEFEYSLDSLIEKTGGEWHLQIKEAGGELIYTYKADDVIHPGSVIKVPLAMLFFEALNSQSIVDVNTYIKQHGIGGRSYHQLLEAMLVNSEEDATELLYGYTKMHINPEETLENWGFAQTSFSPRATTVQEISRLFEGLWLNRQLSEAENQIIKGFLGTYTPGDDTRIGVIRESLPENVHFFSKRGSLVSERVIVAEVAVLEIEGRVFIISIFAYPDYGKTKPTYDDLEASIQDAARLIWDHLENFE